MAHTIPDPLTVAAPAKINLFLHVGPRRADGFHALESLVVFTAIGDRLLFEDAPSFSLCLDGPFGTALAHESDNLIVRAAHALATKAGRAAAVKITLTKNLPVASGIGGGSADAAATLRGLAVFWNLNTDLAPIAETLGSDVPACLSSKALWMEGRGEQVTAVAGFPSLPMVLVNPRIEVPTAKIFGALDRRTGLGAAPPPHGLHDVLEVAHYLKETRNDLETPARNLAPVIGDVLDALRRQNALLVRMSGSGATCFGLFADDAAADRAATAIVHRHPGWWAGATRTLP